MITYLFISHPDNNHDDVQRSCFWTCSSTTTTGDQILVYVTETGIQYEWRAVSKAEKIADRDYECLVEYVRTFAPPIALSEICNLVSKPEWPPPHLNFRGYKSIQIPPPLIKRLISGRSSYQAVHIDPKSAVTYYNRGNAYADTFRYDGAFQNYNRALQLDPEFALAYNAHGLVYADQGQHQKAINDFNQAIKLDPNLAIAFSNRGMSYADQNNFTQAMTDCHHAIQLDQNNAWLYYHRGVIFHYQGDYARAVADYSEAIRRMPDVALFYCYRGTAYFDQRKHNPAIADYREALGLDQKYALAYYNLAMTYADQGDNNKAINYFRRSLQLETDKYWRKQINEHLQKLGFTISEPKTRVSVKSQQPQTYKPGKKAPVEPLQPARLSSIEKLVRIGADFDVVLDIAGYAAAKNQVSNPAQSKVAVKGTATGNPAVKSQIDNRALPSDEWTRCSICLTEIKIKNLAKHNRKYHKLE